MDATEIRKLINSLLPELTFTTSRSSGPGGQHINKVSTKVELRFNILKSEVLSDELKILLIQKLKSKITSLGDLIITSQATRSQLKNKETTIEKFSLILEKALTSPKKRKPTKPSRAAKEKRIESKRKLSEKKDKRRPPEIL